MANYDWTPLRRYGSHEKTPECSLAMCGTEPMTDAEKADYWRAAYNQMVSQRDAEATRTNILASQLRTATAERDNAVRISDVMVRDRDHYRTSADLYYEETIRFKQLLRKKGLCTQHANLECQEDGCRQWWVGLT